MDRRSFFRRIRSDELTNVQVIDPIKSGLKPFKGKLSQDQLNHLVRRTLFGVHQKDLAHFRKKNIRKIVRELASDETELPAPPVNNYNDPDSKKEDPNYFVDEEIPPGKTWVNSTTINGKNNGRRKNSFKSWWYGLMLRQSPNLREKMVLFWHNHFATETNVVDNAVYIYRHNDLLRKHALGNFKELVKGVTSDMAMLKYLNGTASTKKAPDENYGRELQELFTVGKGPGSQYTENDVKAAARVLTGFRNDNKTYTAVFDPSRHDEGDKQFSAFYNNRLIKGRKGVEANMETAELIEMIFEQEEVSKFICRKLYRFFVYHTIDADTEQGVIVPLAAIFRKEQYEIAPVLTALLSSEHFFDQANRGGMIKSPVDFTVGLCREFDAAFPNDAAVVEQYALWEQFRNQAASMQQNIGDPPNVAGWQAYYQEPQFDKLWISSDTLPRRNQFTDRMINNGFERNGKRVNIDPLAFIRQLDHPENPDLLIEACVRRLYAIDISKEDKQFIKTSILLSGLTGMQSDHYWTDSWNNYIQKPDEKKNRDLVLKKAKALLKYLMNRPEYQLC